jgi:uncharacterized protein
MLKIYTLYHNNCPDGFGSALAAYLKFGDKSEYIGVKHQQDPPEMEPGSEVYILDFSYPRQVMEALLEHHTQVILSTTIKPLRKPCWDYVVLYST